MLLFETALVKVGMLCLVMCSMSAECTAPVSLITKMGVTSYTQTPLGIGPGHVFYSAMKGIVKRFFPRLEGGI